MKPSDLGTLDTIIDLEISKYYRNAFMRFGAIPNYFDGLIGFESIPVFIHFMRKMEMLLHFLYIKQGEGDKVHKF